MLTPTHNTIVSVALVAMLTACAHSDYRPSSASTPVEVDSELEGLKVLAAVPGALPVVQVSLAQQFMATGRDWEGLRYFEERSREGGGSDVTLALEGLFMARVAGDVPLLKRVAWVEDALTRLDRAAQSGNPGARLFRGVVSAAVPERFGRASIAVDELTWVLEHPEAFPASVERGVLYSLAQAYDTLGDKERSADALRRSGHTSLAPGQPVFFGDAAWTSDEGFRFASPAHVDEVAEGVYVATGYDFAEQIFFVTDEGLVAIDACSSPENARAALQALKAQTVVPPLTHVILTHAHEDHTGGLSAYAGEGVEVIAHHHMHRVAGGLRHAPNARRFWPGGWDEPLPKPSRLVEQSELLEVGGRTFELIPTASGETEDALLIFDRATGTLVVGDAFMPYVGAPFVNEGSPQALIDNIRTIRKLAPKQLLHGHPPLTRLYTVEVIPVLERALTTLHSEAKAAMEEGRSPAQVIAKNIVPDVLRGAPAAALPYIVMRDHFIQRLFHVEQGYWSGERVGLEPRTRTAWAGALDLMADGDPDRFAKVAGTLLQQGDLALAFEIADLGLQQHPKHEALHQVRSRALGQLRQKYHGINPFKFIMYSAMSGDELEGL